MKLYNDPEEGLVLSVNDEGYAFPVDYFLVAMARGIGGDALHKEIIEQAIADNLAGKNDAQVAQLGGAGFPEEHEDYQHPYAGRTVEDIIENLGEPEII